jgi:hypothetical protein
LLKCFPAWVRLFFRPAIGAAGKRRKNGRRAQDNAAANCLGEVIERLSMTEIEIDCETAMKDDSISVQAEGHEVPLCLSLTCRKVLRVRK